jgi:hypothetical protein
MDFHQSRLRDLRDTLWEIRATAPTSTRLHVKSCLSLAFSIGGDPGLVRLDRFGAGRKGVSRSAI